MSRAERHQIECECTGIEICDTSIAEVKKKVSDRGRSQDLQEWFLVSILKQILDQKFETKIDSRMVPLTCVTKLDDVQRTTTNRSRRMPIK